MPRPATLPEEPKAPAEEPAGGSLITTFELDGNRYELRSGTWNYRDERDLYDATGLGIPKAINEVNAGNGSPLMVGAIVFIARRAAGEHVTVDQVMAGIQWDTPMVFGPAVEDEEAPKDQADN